MQIYPHDTAKWGLTNGAASAEFAPVRIGDYCFIGSWPAIDRDVTTGNRCMIGTCAFVDRDLPLFSVAAGAAVLRIGRAEVKSDSAGSSLVSDAAIPPHGRCQAQTTNCDRPAQLRACTAAKGSAVHGAGIAP